MQALVIDDSKAMRAILKRLLEELGFGPVYEAANGADALAALGYMGETQLVLVDWNMPEMNGLEFVTAVRANPSFNGVRLMMVTTETEINQVRRALDAGANEYLMKPFTTDVLRDKLSLMGLATSA